MRVKALKSDVRYELRNDKSLGVQNYGESNDYPQQIMQVVDASGTGKSCVNVYAKFISGKGFADKNFYKKIVNQNGQSNDYILDQISKDYAYFGGFSIHVNYNANFKITEIQHIPFEHVRLEKMDDDGNFNRVAIHPDWARQFLLLRKWRKDDIEFIDLFNPHTEEVQKQVDLAGGWQNYKGQVFYFSNKGEKVYPLPIYDSVITDMNTEEGISNVSNRNVKNNFFAAGMFIDKKADNKSVADEKGQEDEKWRVDDEKGQDDENETEKALKGFQGDEKACKILYVRVDSDDEKPEFVPFKGTNYDKEFNVTLESSQNNIGQSFNQPPILRAKDVGGNFGADLMKNAYNFYNSVTENERLNVERTFTTIFNYWFESSGSDYSIIPLSYEVEVTVAERIGKNFMPQIINILNSTVLSVDQKKSTIKTLFGLTEEESNNLLPVTTTV